MTKEIGDSTLVDTWAATGTTVEPDISKKNQGWTLGERPPFEFMNWLQNLFGKKINHMLSRGVADWDTSTSYAVGATVNHAGSLWVALVANDASEPTGANTNWSEVITDGSQQQVGVGQTWQDVKASRVWGTSYQNTTGKPIQLSVCFRRNDRNLEVSPDNTTWVIIGRGTDTSTVATPTTPIIPDGWYYRVGGTSPVDDIYVWSELR